MIDAARYRSVQRRALLRNCGLTGLTGLAGCAGLLDSGPSGESSEGTVNPDLQGTPTVSDDAAWSVTVPDVFDIERAGSNFLVSISVDEETARYRAFDARSGTKRWTTEALLKDSYTVDIGDVLLAVTAAPPGQDSNSDSVTAINPNTGSVLWQRGGGTGWIGVADDALLLREVESDGERSGVLVVDRRTGRLRWKTDTDEQHVRVGGDEVVTITRNLATPSATQSPGTPDTPSPTETTETAVDTSSPTETTTPPATETQRPTETEVRSHELRGRSPRTGEIQWRVAVSRGVEGASAFRPLDDRILFVEEFGSQTIVDTDTEEIVSKLSIPKEQSTYPVARYGATMYFGDWTFRGATPEPGYLSGIDVGDGSSWTREFPGNSVRPVKRPSTGDFRLPDSANTVDAPTALYANHLGDKIETVAHDPSDGTVRWRREAIAVSLDERGPVVSQPGALVALDADGGERWRSAIPFDGRVTNGIGNEDGGYVARFGDVLFVSNDGGVASYDLADGTRRQTVTSFDLSDNPRTALADQTVVFARENRLHAYHL